MTRRRRGVNLLYRVSVSDGGKLAVFYKQFADDMAEMTAKITRPTMDLCRKLEIELAEAEKLKGILK